MRLFKLRGAVHAPTVSCPKFGGPFFTLRTLRMRCPCVSGNAEKRKSYSMMWSIVVSLRVLWFLVSVVTVGKSSRVSDL